MAQLNPAIKIPVDRIQSIQAKCVKIIKKLPFSQVIYEERDENAGAKDTSFIQNTANVFGNLNSTTSLNSTLHSTSEQWIKLYTLLIFFRVFSFVVKGFTNEYSCTQRLALKCVQMYSIAPQL